MSILVKSDNPEYLLTQVYAAIRESRVDTWLADDDGDFTHSPPQWRDRAWFRPRIVRSGIVFVTIPPAQVPITERIYAVYHGRFIEMLLAHFDELFQEALASAQPSRGDRTK